MSKTINKWSSQASKSLFVFLNKFITFLFAIYCVASGQARNVKSDRNRQNDTISVKGNVYSAADSSILGNIKVMLEYSLNAWYGMVYEPMIDTTANDGSYKVDSPYQLPIMSNRQFLVAVDVDGEENGSFATCTLDVELRGVTSDTTINLYLNPENVSNVNDIPNLNGNITILHSDIITIKFNDIDLKSGTTVDIYNIAGKIVDKLTVEKSGIVKWKAKDFAKGTYYIKMKINEKLLSTKLLIQ